MPFRILTSMLTSILVPALLLGQSAGAGRPGKRPLMDRAAEVALARSGAPASVSAGATVYVFTDSGFVVAERGATDAVCLVNRSWPESLEPECFDAEAAATVMLMEMRRTTLYHQGVPTEDVERRIAAELARGDFRLPMRPAVVYMMSEGQKLISDDGRPAGNWRPHLMIHYPFLTNEAVGHHGEPGIDGGMVIDSGRPTANLTVVVPGFVKVAPASKKP
ncbi:MAG: hypothetical protein FJ206_13950 [Gemmatimonadetes bacterium]|nr:hypothetical protein [Gemmatimonadota bacterium]